MRSSQQSIIVKCVLIASSSFNLAKIKSNCEGIIIGAETDGESCETSLE